MNNKAFSKKIFEITEGRLSTNLRKLNDIGIMASFDDDMNVEKLSILHKPQSLDLWDISIGKSNYVIVEMSPTLKRMIQSISKRNLDSSNAHKKDMKDFGKTLERASQQFEYIRSRLEPIAKGKFK